MATQTAAREKDNVDVKALLRALRTMARGDFSYRLPLDQTGLSGELAQAFNVFYHKHHILSEEDPEKRAFLLQITALAREQLVTVLRLLGINAPEKM